MVSMSVTLRKLFEEKKEIEKVRRTTPAPPSSEVFAALTIDVTPRVVIDV